MDEAGLVNNLQRVLRRCADGKVRCGHLNNIVSASNVLNLDCVRTLVRPVLVVIGHIGMLILALRDYVVCGVSDRDRGPLHLAVVLGAGRRQLDIGRHSLLADGHFYRANRAVRVVVVALGLVVDRVLTGILGLGNGRGVIGAVQGIDQSAARHSARRDQLLSPARVVGQRGHSYRSGIHRRGPRQNRRGGSIGVGNLIVGRLRVRNRRSGASDGNGLICPDVRIIEGACQVRNVERIAKHQVACGHLGLYGRGCAAVKGLVNTGQHRRHRLLARAELPRSGHVGVVAVYGAGRRDHQRPAHVLHGEQSGGADGAGAGAAVLGLDLPADGPITGAARGAELDGIAIVDLGLGAGDRNCLLARRTDFEGSDVDRTISSHVVIGGWRRGDGDGVGVHIYHTVVAIRSGNCRHVLTFWNQAAVIVVDGDGRFLLAAIVNKRILGQ